ncbi:MAG: FAD-binding oxidoreductase [Sphingobacteriales bacterium]|nr:FAD-binding oxidoreductase [Sphingobacteriales bacterium]
MLVDFLIIGQGISGTWLSYYLGKENKSFLVIDNNFQNAPSRLAAGIINPVTGRRHATVWMANKLLLFAWNAYNELGKELNIKAISQKNIIDFFPSPQMRLSFQQRVEEKGEFVSLNKEDNRYSSYFHYEFGYGVVTPAYTAHLETIIPAWRKKLKDKNQLLEEEFDISLLESGQKQIHYKDITANKIIFCDGAGCADNPYFKLLPFAPNKGEALTLKISGLPDDHIFKKGMMLVPLATPGEWWIGSSYEWEFTDTHPSENFRKKTEQLLKEWLKVPFTVTDHLAGLRPATLERRPFVGLHPFHPNIGILNGMGTKGCSLAPFFARQLADHLLFQKPVTPEADISRFSKILSR